MAEEKIWELYGHFQISYIVLYSKNMQHSVITICSPISDLLFKNIIHSKFIIN